ncbi:MAG: M20/M25/M40 family metallo-hydrolase [Candidatus Korobacteraceae bacterium]
MRIIPFVMRECRIVVLISALLLSSSGISLAQSNDAVMQQALSPSSPLQENLRVLTDEIGGRIPGTPAFQKATQWAVDGFKAAGVDSVHTEEFTMPISWAEGATEVEVVAPVKFHVLAHSIAWAPALKPTTARVVDAGMGTAAEFAKAGDVTGAIVLVHSDVLKTWDDLFQEYYRAPGIIALARQGRALAIAFTSSREHDLLYRHINAMNGNIDVIPQVLLAREDSERIARLLAHGEKVQMSLSMPNQIGPTITTRNVVAELKGTELPNEIVILGAHLDSWELGTGALDNGCNAALVIDTLRAIKMAGIRPKRTMRFILFSGEEEGLLGSYAYVRAHQNELDNIVAELVLDEGSGPVVSFSTGGRNDVDAALTPMVQPFAQWNANQVTNDATVGTDNYDFMLQGVPTILPNQAEANYLINYHASSDTFDKVDFAQLKKNEAMAAELMVELANAPQRIGPRITRSQIEATFKDTHLDDQMKGFGLWDDWQNGTRGRKP